MKDGVTIQEMSNGDAVVDLKVEEEINSFRVVILQCYFHDKHDRVRLVEDLSGVSQGDLASRTTRDLLSFNLTCKYLNTNHFSTTVSSSIISAHSITTMFSKLTTKIALRKVGIPSNTFNASNFESKPSNPKDPNANELLPFANPFANLSVPKSWQSWTTPPPPPVEIAPAPVIGTRAPDSVKLRLPGMDGRPTIVVFLRNTGCVCEF